MKNIILRALVGLILGIGYAVCVGVIALLLFLLTPDSGGSMIPNYHDIGAKLLLTMYVTLFAVACGVVVGLLVGLSGVGKAGGGIIGGVIGSGVFLYVTRDLWSALTLPTPLHRDLLTFLILFLLGWPVGLALTGIAVSIVAGKLKR
jgi:hypothetical protein